MATEYTLYSAAELSTDEILAFMATAVDGSTSPHGYVEREGLQVTAYAVPAADQAATVGVFGFVHHITARFRFANGAPPAVTNTNTVLMVRAALRLFQDYQADGVLLFNGEQVVAQRLRAEVALNGEWEDFAEIEELRQAVAGYPLRTLAQPFL
jgi:hypothetical protein